LFINFWFPLAVTRGPDQDRGRIYAIGNRHHLDFLGRLRQAPNQPHPFEESGPGWIVRAIAFYCGGSFKRDLEPKLPALSFTSSPELSILGQSTHANSTIKSKDHMKRTIEVTVTTAGEINIEGVGFKGADCEQATQYLEAALGTVSRKVKKPEYHQRTVARNQQKIGN
ncbi:MAG: hypothetical protein JWM16_2511, partial [Verrucomicrobiales bacterium]|nr:hypothetical protein [Verrucomicrobiales bacterium]